MPHTQKIQIRKRAKTHLCYMLSHS